LKLRRPALDPKESVAVFWPNDRFAWKPTFADLVEEIRALRLRSFAVTARESWLR